MPQYEYKCDVCDFEEELLIPLKEIDEVYQCPACNNAWTTSGGRAAGHAIGRLVRKDFYLPARSVFLGKGVDVTDITGNVGQVATSDKELKSLCKKHGKKVIAGGDKSRRLI